MLLTYEGLIHDRVPEDAGTGSLTVISNAGQEGKTMTREEAEVFAAEWAAAWNDLDVERVLAHFDEHASFTSPTALAVAGVGTVQGKQALRDYWNTAVARVGSLRFVVDRVLWDAGSRELAIIYVSDAGGRRKWISENLTFGHDGLVVSAEVFHGVDG